MPLSLINIYSTVVSKIAMCVDFTMTKKKLLFTFMRNVASPIILLISLMKVYLLLRFQQVSGNFPYRFVYKGICKICLADVDFKCGELVEDI